MTDLTGVILAEIRLHTEESKSGSNFGCTCGSWSRRYGFKVHLADQIAQAVQAVTPC